MKDGKYEVGDVIAFRVTDTNPTQQKLRGAGAVLASETDSAFIYKQSPFPEEKQAILERIPNPKLMEGEWWKEWRVEYRSVKAGELFIINSDTPMVNRNAHAIEMATYARDLRRLVLIPPPSGPCPELKAKIEKLEADLNAKSAELAELKKQALR